MVFKLTRNLVVSLCVVLIGCSKSVNINGRIDKTLHASLMKKDLRGFTLKVNSHGGEVKYAALIAKKLSKENVSVSINKQCISACVEFFLPAASTIDFKGEPLIGIHWGSVLNFRQMERYGGQINKCDLTNLRIQEGLFRGKGLNLDFWLETEKRLIVSRYEIIKKGTECPWKVREFENYMWLPNSQQLKTLWGLKFNGKVCSDNPSRCKKRIDRWWKKGTKLVIGDDVYISRGY